MHRRFIACILVALMAQVSMVESQQKLLENFPSYSQDDTGWCAWVSAQMVLKYYGYSVPPQKIAVKTFELANEIWSLEAVKADKNGLPLGRIPDYENAIMALSNNSLEIEEIAASDKDKLLYKIYESMDSGCPIIILSTAPWLYDVYGGKYPAGAHASVIVGYSLDFKTNENLAGHPFDLNYPGVLASLVSSPPALRLQDPATAALGEGAYWLSYKHFFDKTTSSKEFLKLIVVKRRANKDTDFPKVEAFDISPRSLTAGESLLIAYEVSDNGGSGLKQVELWRKDESSDWQHINTNTLAGETGLLSTFIDIPSVPGTCWYGVHVVDNAGNWNDEKNSNTNNKPGVYGPIDVYVTELQSVQEQRESIPVTFKLYVYDGSADGPVISDANVEGLDGKGNRFQQTTDSSGYVTIEGEPGTWSFSASADGYETNSWDQEISKTCTKHAFLQKEPVAQSSEYSVVGKWKVHEEFIITSTSTDPNHPGAHTTKGYANCIFTFHKDGTFTMSEWESCNYDGYCTRETVNGLDEPVTSEWIQNGDMVLLQYEDGSTDELSLNGDTMSWTSISDSQEDAHTIVQYKADCFAERIDAFDSVNLDEDPSDVQSAED